jgi:RNA recognition motif-containing protein
MSSVEVCLRVAALSICCNETHLLEIFREFGTVVGAVIKQTQDEKQFLRQGFVTFLTVMEAENAMTKLNGLMVLGRKIRYKYDKQTVS